ncbi:MAG: signal peptidase I [candidate division WOR-3 bacterium]
MKFGKAIKNFIASWGPVIIVVLLLRSFVVEAFMVPTGSMEDTILIGDFMLVNKFIYGIKLPFTNKTLINFQKPKRGDIVVFRYPLDPDFPEPSEKYIRFFPRWLPLLPLYWNKEKNFFYWYAPRSFIKRCIAIAGDTVEIRDKRLYVNGQLQNQYPAVHKDLRVFRGLNSPYVNYQELWEKAKFIDNPEVGAAVRDNFGPVVVPDGCIFAMGDNRDNSSDSRFWGPLDLKYVKGKPLVIYFSSDAAPNIARIILSPTKIRWERIGRLLR